MLTIGVALEDNVSKPMQKVADNVVASADRAAAAVKQATAEVKTMGQQMEGAMSMPAIKEAPKSLDTVATAMRRVRNESVGVGDTGAKSLGGMNKSAISLAGSLVGLPPLITRIGVATASAVTIGTLGLATLIAAAVAGTVYLTSKLNEVLGLTAGLGKFARFVNEAVEEAMGVTDKRLDDFFREAKKDMEQIKRFNELNALAADEWWRKTHNVRSELVEINKELDVTVKKYQSMRLNSAVKEPRGKSHQPNRLEPVGEIAGPDALGSLFDSMIGIPGGVGGMGFGGEFFNQMDTLAVNHEAIVQYRELDKQNLAEWAEFSANAHQSVRDQQLATIESFGQMVGGMLAQRQFDMANFAQWVAGALSAHFKMNAQSMLSKAVEFKSYAAAYATLAAATVGTPTSVMAARQAAGYSAAAAKLGASAAASAIAGAALNVAGSIGGGLAAGAGGGGGGGAGRGSGGNVPRGTFGDAGTNRLSGGASRVYNINMNISGQTRLDPVTLDQIALALRRRIGDGTVVFS